LCPEYINIGTTYDLTPLLSHEELALIPAEKRMKLRKVRIKNLEAFPTKLLKKYTSLDDDQLTAIHNCLTKVFLLTSN
jgi:hypothetical protein